MGRIGAGLTVGIAFASGLVALGLLAQATSGRLPTTSVAVDRGTYYRLTVDLAYKGEPVSFNIVVGCNVRITRHIDRDRSVEVGIAPFVYGLKMSDGAGVVVRPPEACAGDTSAGRVPPDLLPLVIVYEDADRPFSGVGYASEDAYRSPLSVLEFRGAEIRSATRADWEAWRATEAGKNIVKPEMISFNVGEPFKDVPWRPGAKLFGHWCRGVRRLAMPEEARAAVRPHWPAERPEFWFPTYEGRRALIGVAGNIASNKGTPFEGRHFHAYSTSYVPEIGLPRDSGQGSILGGRAVGAIYPALSDETLNKLGPDGKLLGDGPLLVMDAQVRPELKGFVYCDSDGTASFKGAPRAWSPGQPFSARVNGQEISRPATMTVPPLGGQFFFERDEYVYKDVTLGTTTIFGGL